MKPVLREHQERRTTRILQSNLFGRRKERWPRRSRNRPKRIMSNRPVELGSLDYVNLTQNFEVMTDLTVEKIVAKAKSQGKMILANFVEWPG